MDRKLAIDNAINKVNLYSSLMQAIDGKKRWQIIQDDTCGRKQWKALFFQVFSPFILLVLGIYMFFKIRIKAIVKGLYQLIKPTTKLI